MSVSVSLPLRKQDENYYQTFSHDGVTVNSEYASVMHTNNTTAVATGDNLVCYNCKEANKNKSRNKYVIISIIFYLSYNLSKYNIGWWVLHMVSVYIQMVSCSKYLWNKHADLAF